MIKKIDGTEKLNNTEKISRTKSHTPEINEENIFNSIKSIIIKSHNNIARTINSEMVNAYWNIGKYIYEAQGNKQRADYGTYLVKYLSKKLTIEFGKGFDVSNLKNMRQFYNTFEKSYTVCSQSQKHIGQALSAQSQECPEPLLKLSWSHIRTIMRIPNEERRDFYVNECSNCNWSVRQLERQIGTSYYERLLVSQHKDIIKNEMQSLEPYKENPLEILKDPYILEFLNMKENKDYLEKELESKIMDNLQKFILEMGKGFSFVARQKRISFDTDNFYIDLVFYNYILKCFVLIDLKAGTLTHQDMGQMDMYISYFDTEIKQDNDNPTIGIVLCNEKNNAVVKYSTLNTDNRLFTSKYILYLPTEAELANYIEEQRELLEREYKNKE